MKQGEDDLGVASGVRRPAFVVPVEKEKLVRQIYDWGGRNCELHFCQVRGDFQPYRGVNLSTFLPASA